MGVWCMVYGVWCRVEGLCHEDDASEEVGDGGKEYALGRAPEFEGVEHEKQCEIGEDTHLQDLAEDISHHVQIEGLEGVCQVETIDIDISYKGRKYKPQEDAKPICIKSLRRRFDLWYRDVR